jgi:nucleotide-binding universal stress UspA family protein
MFDEILACLDGSSLAEKILPLARGITLAKGGKLTLLRVVGDATKFSAKEDCLRDCARRYSAALRFVVGSDPAKAIRTELERHPRATVALTAHGRTALAEAILGTVSMQVIREAKSPVIVFHPLENNREAPHRINTVVVALDGNKFAEKILPYAVNTAQSLAAKLLLIQALPIAAPPPILAHEKSDIVESSYLHRKANAIKADHGIAAQWEVLHGDPAEAICRYVKGMPDTMLAMTTHARGGMERVVLGSIAAACVRHAGVPLLLYWPHD